MKLTLTEKQQAVIDMLKKLSDQKQEAVTPTEVGLAMGFSYDSASSKCMSGIKKAVEIGLVEKVGRGKYRHV